MAPAEYRRDAARAGGLVRILREARNGLEAIVLLGRGEESRDDGQLLSGLAQRPPRKSHTRLRGESRR